MREASDDKPAGTPAEWRRFVVQHHVVEPGAHWDLMFEHGSALATWRCPCPLAEVAELPVELTRLADHRSAYLDYEGPVSGGRGQVEIDERGRYCALERTEGELVVQVEGGRTRGWFRLRRRGAASEEWEIVRIELPPGSEV